MLMVFAWLSSPDANRVRRIRDDVVVTPRGRGTGAAVQAVVPEADHADVHRLRAGRVAEEFDRGTSRCAPARR
jgi:hypothetical protein